MTAPVHSPHNPRVAAARKLLRAKERAAARAFLAEGPHAVGEALAAGRTAVRELFVTPGAARRETELLRRADRRDVPIVVVTDRVLATLGDTVSPQGVVAVVAMPDDRLDQLLAGTPRLVAVLCAVADPGNAGTVIRTADAAGADAVLLTAGSVDPYNGKAVRASAGSLFHLPVLTGVDRVDVVGRLRGSGLTVLAAAADGDEALDDLADAGALDGRTAWLFGSEARGLDPATLAGADHRVRVPIRGHAESLNLAAAAAVCLFASARAHRR